MSLSPGSFRPGELAGADTAPSDVELAAAYGTARELEAALPAEHVLPSPAFLDRVMAAVALEPVPRRAGFLAPLQAHPGPSGLIASLRAAWIVVAGGAGRAATARGLALAYVLAVVVVATSLSGLAAYGAAGALGILGNSSSPTPTISVPTPEPSSTPEPTRTPEPTGSAEPSELPSPEPSTTETPEPSESPSATTRPSPPLRPTSSPTAKPSDSGGGESPSPSADDGHSPEPSDTPNPSDTPKPSATPG